MLATRCLETKGEVKKIIIDDGFRNNHTNTMQYLLTYCSMLKSLIYAATEESIRSIWMGYVRVRNLTKRTVRFVAGPGSSISRNMNMNMNANTKRDENSQKRTRGEHYMSPVYVV